MDDLRSLTTLEKRIDYRFRNPNGFQHALRRVPGKEREFQRLEFLGDHILGLAAAQWLYHHFPKASEGEMSRRHRHLVCGKALQQVSHRLELHHYCPLLTKEVCGDEGDENPVPRTFADTVEALIAAIFLDGGIVPVQRLIEQEWDFLLQDFQDQPPPLDAKSALQEWALQRGLGLPHYQVQCKNGPDHNPRFTVRLTLGDYPPQTAVASSKNRAQQSAAKKLLEFLS